MKNTYTLAVLVFLSFSLQLRAQLQSAPYSVPAQTYAKPNPGSNSKRNITNPKSCGTDTLEYGRYKASAFPAVTVNRGRSLAQYYSAPQKITIYGFSFYGIVSSVPASPKKIKIICNLYKANADSLPTGAPLRSDTVSIDSSFYPSLNKMERKAIFKKPITMDSAYILAVESDSANLNAAIFCNSWTNGDGNREFLNAGSINNLWYRGYNLNVGGVRFDSDIILEPYVSYKFGNDFSVKNQCYNISDTVKLTNNSRKSVCSDRMYNRYIMYGLEYFCHYWNYGNNTAAYTIDGAVKYSTKADYNIMLISNVYGYRNFNACADTTIKTVYFTPARPGINGPVNVCTGDSAVFTATGDTGVVYEWSKTIGGTPFQTGLTYKKYNVTASDTFFVRARNKSCYSQVRQVIMTVNAYPPAPVVENDSVCSGSRANLKASASPGKIDWYTDLNGGSRIFTGDVYQTPVLSTDTAFYVESNNNGCISKGSRIKVEALVGADFAPQAPVTSNDTLVCLSGTASVTISASAPVGTIRWFSQPSGGSSINTGNTHVFYPVQKEVRTFYADAWNGVCGSSRIPVTITVEKHPALLSYTHDTICSGDSAVLTASSDYGNIYWYDNPGSTTPVFSGTRFVNYNQVNTIIYYLETESSGCVSPTRTPVKITANTFAPLTNISAPSVCAKNPATLSVSAAFGNIYWYDSDTATVPVKTGTSYTTPSLNGARTFYVMSENKGCKSPKTPVNVSVKSTPFSGFSYEVKPNRTVVVSPISPPTGCKIFWDFDDGSTAVTSTVAHKFNSNRTFNVKLVLTLISTGCKDSTIIPIMIDNSSVGELSVLSRLKVYPNPGNGKLNLEMESRSSLQSEVLVYDLTGKTVFRMPVALVNGMNSISFDTQLQPGMYILSVANRRQSLLVE